jgi:hypothetical protein
MTGATSGTGIAYPSGVPGFTPCFSWVHVAQSFVFCIVFCRPLVFFSIFLLVNVLSILQFTFSDYLFGIRKPLLTYSHHNIRREIAYMFNINQYLTMSIDIR